MNPRNLFLALSAALLFGLAPAVPLRAQDDQDDASPPAKPAKGLHHASASNQDDQVTVAGANTVDAGQTVGDAVAVMGPLTVDGHVRGDAVAIMGNNTINGTVDQGVVCVLGDLTLGPKAHVAQDVVCVMGHLQRDPGAFVGGKVVHQLAMGPHLHFVGLHNWWIAGLSHGQLLPFGPHVFWLWGLNLMMIFVYVVLALLFPNAMRRTGDMLVLRPVHVLLSGFLAILALPILFVLLLVTVIGIPVAICLLPVTFFLLVYFGKASLYGLLGRKLTNERASIAFAVLLGGLLALVVLAFPVISIAFYLVMSYLGFGCALTALMQGRNTGAAGVPPTQSGAPVYPAPGSGFPSPVGGAGAPVTPSAGGFAPAQGAVVHGAASAGYPGTGVPAAPYPSPTTQGTGALAQSASQPTYPSPTIQSAGATAEPSLLGATPAQGEVFPGAGYTGAQAAGAAPQSAATPTYPNPAPQSAGGTGQPSVFAAAPAQYGSLPPTLPLDATLPRATFWIRTAAMAIDIVIIAIGTNFLSHGMWLPHHHDTGPGSFLILLGAYAAVMWKLKGTTVGGLICHLHVVRLDGRPIDWPTAIVRALGCFVSLCPVGLGFIWVAFDAERQSWHDKLAGTTVVISVTRRSLV